MTADGASARLLPIEEGLEVHHPEPDLPARQRAARAQGFLEKPLDLQRLFATLDAHLPRPR
jgi:hypothetical protein